MFTEAKVEQAVEFLRENAKEAAQARANRYYLEQYLKSVKAKVKAAQVGMSNSPAEDVALLSPDYLEALAGYQAAVERDAFFSFKREAATAMIEAWRTQQANMRAEGRAYG